MGDAIPKVTRVIVTVLRSDGRSSVYDLKDPISAEYGFDHVMNEDISLSGPVIRVSPSKIKFGLEVVVDGKAPAYISTHPVEGS